MLTQAETSAVLVALSTAIAERESLKKLLAEAGDTDKLKLVEIHLAAQYSAFSKLMGSEYDH